GWSPSRIQRRSQQGNQTSSGDGSSYDREPRVAVATPHKQREAAKQRHQNHRQADDVQDVHAKQVRPWSPSPGDEIFLQAEEESEAKDFGAAAKHGAGDYGRAQAFAHEFVSNQSEGNS